MKSVLKKLSIGKAVGSDGINNRVIRELANALVDPPSLFYNIALQNSKVPDDWKETHVCSIHKGGDPVLVFNYRSVSLLNTLDKTFKRYFLNTYTIILFYLYNLNLCLVILLLIN